MMNDSTYHPLGQCLTLGMMRLGAVVVGAAIVRGDAAH
jgi:hypothetical protein